MKNNDKTNEPFLLVRFKDEESQVKAANQLVNEGTFRWDAISPYLNEASKLAIDPYKKQILARLRTFTFLGACFGILLAFVWIWSTQWNVSPRLEVQGRVPGWDQLAVYVPVIFELMILFAGVGLIIGFLSKAKLPRWYDRCFDVEFFEIDDKGDGYFLIIQCDNFDKIRHLFEFCNIENRHQFVTTVDQKGGINDQ